MGAAGQARLIDPIGFAAGLLSDRDLVQRARRIIATFAELFPESALNLYIPENVDVSLAWRVRATTGDVRADTNLLAQMEVFQSLLQATEPESRVRRLEPCSRGVRTP